jgi:predicted negative regulator of RcsB-dependent stress response
MKSQRRHELHHNALADWLGQTYEQIRPYQNVILGGVLLLLVAVVGYKWWSHQSARRVAEASESLGRAWPLGAAMANPADLEQVIQRHPGTPAAQWATIVSADFSQAQGANALFSDKARAREELSKAADTYQMVLKESRVPVLRERATFGLARTLETQCNVPEAEKYYRQVTEQWPDGAFAVAAQKRLHELGKAGIQDFYDSFAAFDPRAAAPKAPTPMPQLPLGTLPDNPPGEPTLQYKSPFNTDLLKTRPAAGKTEEKTKTETSGTEKTTEEKTAIEKTEEKKTAAEKPEAEKPSAEKGK